jgi:hypothetical protein
VRRSWAISPSGGVEFVEPENWLFEPGDWDRVEAALGTRLPRDYKELIGEGLACVLDEELFVASPFDPDRNVNLAMMSARAAWGLAELRHDLPDHYTFVIYPEPGGWLCWGMMAVAAYTTGTPPILIPTFGRSSLKADRSTPMSSATT